MPTGSTAFLVFTGVVTFAVVLQTIILLAVLVAAKTAQRKALEQVERLRADMRPILDSAGNIIAAIEGITPRLRATAENVHSASERLRDQVTHIDSVMGDVTGKARHQVNRIDNMVTDTLNAVAHGTRVVQDNVMAPLRQIGGWMSAIRTGMDMLRGGERRSRRSSARSEVRSQQGFD
jgi:methyl-accepting chemotaxis protein